VKKLPFSRGLSSFFWSLQRSQLPQRTYTSAISPLICSIEAPSFCQPNMAHLRAARRVLSSISRNINSPLDIACRLKK
jgi:hypothetical protein